MSQRKTRNSSKVNLTISLVFHSVLICAITFLAAREGMLGKKLKTLAVTMVPKEKKAEPVKEKPPEPKAEAPKVAQEKRPEAGPAPKAETAAAPPPAESGPASIAPAMVNAPDMLFSEGAKEVITTSDSETIYKGLVERTLRAHWNRPEDVPDDKFMAEVELSVDPAGKLQHYQWLRGSGNARWDDSVKGALAATKALSRPPKGFPDKFTVRFDVETQQTEDALELSLR